MCDVGGNRSNTQWDAETGSAGFAEPIFPFHALACNRALRGWPMLIFVTSTSVSAAAPAIFSQNPTRSMSSDTAWIVARYFAIACLVLLGVIVRRRSHDGTSRMAMGERGK